jgi:hypothetical protein
MELITAQYTTREYQTKTYVWQIKYHYFFEDMTYVVLFKKMASIIYWNLIKTVTVIFKKIAILCFRTYLKGPWFRSCNVNSLGAKLWLKNSSIPNTNKINKNVQALPRSTSMHMDREIDDIPKSTFL